MGQWVIDSFNLEIAIASPSFASLFNVLQDVELCLCYRTVCTFVQPPIFLLPPVLACCQRRINPTPRNIGPGKNCVIIITIIIHIAIPVSSKALTWISDIGEKLNIVHLLIVFF